MKTFRINYKSLLSLLLLPCSLEIGHHELGDHRFVFMLELKSRLFGKMISQDAVFEDPK